MMKMDSSIINKEGIEKLLTMLPSEEEVSKIEEAQELNPELPLGTAEQFLITLSSITGLEARLRLWAFKMDFEVLEKEICEPLSDLKQGLEALHKNSTLKAILNVTLAIGNFLNGSNSRGFQIDYLSKVPEVKDTVHKHSLLYHLTFCVLDALPTATDLYSEIGPITRASRTDFEEVATTLSRMQEECKNSWDYLRIIAKYDEAGEMESRNKTSEFLTDAAERIIIMEKIYRRIMNRFADFLTWLGIPKHLHSEHRVHQVCKTISEFSLEFRTTRERVQQTIAKKREAKERNKSRQKLHELMKLHSQSKESKEVDDLSKMLRVEADGTVPRRKKKQRPREEGERRRREAGEAAPDPAEEEAARRERRRRRAETGERGHRGHRRHRPAELGEPGSEPTGEEESSQQEAARPRRRRRPEELPAVSPEADLAEQLASKAEQRRRRRPAEEEVGQGLDREEPGRGEQEQERPRRHHRRSRPSPNITEQQVQLADGQTVPESTLEAGSGGLFESLMSTAADMGMGTLRRNKERRRSTKQR